MKNMNTLNETPGNLFDYEGECALAHCISADFAFDAGVGQFFQSRYSTRDDLRRRFPHYQWQGHGDCLISNDGNVINLVTKNKVYEKPTLANMREALVSMREVCLERGITKIAMPRIGSGIDGLDWQEVKNIIVDVFMGFEINIRIVYLEDWFNGRILDPDLEKQNFGKDRKNIDGNTSKKYY